MDNHEDIATMSDIRTAILKRNTGPDKVPMVTDLEVGESAINVKDRKIFTKGTENVIQRLRASLICPRILINR